MRGKGNSRGYTSYFTSPDGEKIVSVLKIGGYFDWRKFRVVPERIIIATEKGLYEMVEVDE
jgi:hypothetical protein